VEESPERQGPKLQRAESARTHVVYTLPSLLSELCTRDRTPTSVHVTARDGAIQALQALGYGEREARFLYVVAAHSGYFLRRQYETFAGLRRGASGSRFLRRALAANHIRSIPHSNRTGVFHLFSRPVYRAIGEEDNRNRRQRPHYSVKAKVITLDFVLGRSDRRFLATEREKLEYFVGARGIDRGRLPGKTYTASSSGATTRSYFIEKSPIYFEPNEGSPVTSFCYVDEGALSTSGFMSFLNRYRLLFVSLRRSRLTDVAAEHRPCRRALGVFERFETSLHHPEDLLPSGLLGEYFRLRFYLESRQHHLSDKAKPGRFRHPSAEKSFREWTDQMARSRSSEPVEADFKLHRLYHCYDIF